MEKENHKISVREILKVTKGELVTGNEECLCQNFERDSREVKEGDIYLGIQGETINGSIYFEEAFSNGAKGAILQDIQITKEQKEKYKKLLDKAKYILEQRNKRIQEWSFNTEQIDMFLAGQLEINVLYSIFTDEIISKYNSLSELKIEQKLLSDNNNILECNKKDLIELFDKIQQLSIDGKDIVVEQKQRKCPLCHMEYQDYNELLNRISVVSEQNIELERIDKQIQKNKERQRKINRQLELLIEEAKNQIFAIRRTYEDKYINEIKRLFHRLAQVARKRGEEDNAKICERAAYEVGYSRLGEYVIKRRADNDVNIGDIFV